MNRSRRGSSLFGRMTPRPVVRLKSTGHSPRDRPKALRVLVTSWNLGGETIPAVDEIRASGWFDSGKCDVIAVGAQEAKFQPSPPHSSCENQWFDSVKEYVGAGFDEVCRESFGAMRLSVYVRDTISRSVGNVDVKTEGVGLGHVYNNKGGIGAGFTVLDNVTLAFVSCHLNAHQENVLRRNSDYREICDGIRIGCRWADMVNSYQHLFWFGDLNYRVDTDRETCIRMVKEGRLAELYRLDQLDTARASNDAFTDFEEPRPDFDPTYQYQKGTLEWNVPKNRVPSWTDRVLVRSFPGTDIRRRSYYRTDSMLTSDHMPVTSLFEVGVPPAPVGDSFDDEAANETQVMLGNFSLKLDEPEGVDAPALVFFSRAMSGSMLGEGGCEDAMFSCFGGLGRGGARQVTTGPMPKAPSPQSHLRVSRETVTFQSVHPVDTMEHEHVVVQVVDKGRSGFLSNGIVGYGVVSLRGCFGGRPAGFTVGINHNGINKGTLQGTVHMARVADIPGLQKYLRA